jgi:hypothetical protein
MSIFAATATNESRALGCESRVISAANTGSGINCSGLFLASSPRDLVTGNSRLNYRVRRLLLRISDSLGVVNERIIPEALIVHFVEPLKGSLRRMLNVPVLC